MATEYVLAHTTRRSPLTRVARKVSPGNRRNMVLVSGKKIVKKGVRTTQLSMAEVEENKDRLARWMSAGLLELKLPDGKPFVLGAPAPKPEVKVKSDPTSEPTPEPAPEPEAAEEPAPEPEEPKSEEPTSEEPTDLPKRKNGRLNIRGKKSK